MEANQTPDHWFNQLEASFRPYAEFIEQVSTRIEALGAGMEEECNAASQEIETLKHALEDAEKATEEAKAKVLSMLAAQEQIGNAADHSEALNYISKAKEEAATLVAEAERLKTSALEKLASAEQASVYAAEKVAAAENEARAARDKLAGVEQEAEQILSKAKVTAAGLIAEAEDAHKIATSKRLHSDENTAQTNHQNNLIQEKLAEADRLNALAQEKLAEAEKIKALTLEKLAAAERANAEAEEMLASAEESVSASSSRSSSPRERPQRSINTNVLSAPSKKLQERRVLLVDDAEINRVLMSHYFKGLPVKLDFASSGELALRKCEGSQFDLIVIDAEIQNPSGFDLAAQIKATGAKGMLIALSNQDDRAVVSDAFSHTLSRGLSRDSLIEQLKNFLWVA